MNLEEIARLALDAPYRAQQKWTELAALLEVLKPIKPKNILEIGVYKGGTIRAWTYVADENAHILGVDLPGGVFGGGFDYKQAEEIKILARYKQKIDLLALDSHKKSTVELIQKQGPFDFIFIDADHTYEGAKKDFDSYFPMVKKGGVFAMHDITKHGKHHPDVDVDRLWNEVKEKYNFKEFMDPDYPSDWNPWGGIGCILV